ncbi:MAG: tetrathionate reductase family octaheme c-type cytochrome [bacterium]|nr:tetrathionate reductase family octaheme c-type cytochrome [bacterium]
MPRNEQAQDNPRLNLPEHAAHVDHASLIEGPFADGPSVTRACLECHEDAAGEIMATSHWTWESPTVFRAHFGDSVRLGKRTAMNNFCIGIQSNWPSCTSCHAGYGWDDADFDFAETSNVDCLICHDTSGGYAKGKSGLPAESVDLVEAARSVGKATRQNCGYCHFNGGGGNAVKHGDMDQSLYYPDDWVDVHMGKHDLLCTDCHRTRDHNIGGRAISVSLDTANQIACTDCHIDRPHNDKRLDTHIDAVACQTCHIPRFAVKESTKMHWDWSQAGRDDIVEDEHEYLKIKGSFVYEKQVKPEYAWFNGEAEHYIAGDRIADEGPTAITRPRGDIEDKRAKIWPFKVHRGKQVFDVEHRYLLQPQTAGTGPDDQGYWNHFDWERALYDGAEASGFPFSGEFDFTETEMYWNVSHMVAEADQALACVDCHGEEADRMDWRALGYVCDPIEHGGRRFQHNEDRAEVTR